MRKLVCLTAVVGLWRAKAAATRVRSMRASSPSRIAHHPPVETTVTYQADRLRTGVSWLSLALCCVACSDEKPEPASSSGSANASSAGAATGGNANNVGGSSSGAGGSTNGLPEAPDCEQDQLRIQGESLGQPVDHSERLGSTTLTGRQFYTVEIGKSRLLLRWGAALQANAVIPLSTGGYFRSFWDDAEPEALYCIDEGAITSVEKRPEDDYIKFSITKARSGEVGMTAFSVSAKCDGPEVTVALHGCVFRYAN
jgi:hypothetical protein